VAESCTGGWISKLLTDAPGSSSWFDRCIVAYGNEAKTELLGVRQTLLDNHGAVSRSAVVEMVRGLQARTTASVTLAVSGISGPSGGTPEKPVGTVHLAIATRDGTILPAQFRFHGDRDAIRRQTVDAALRLIAQIRSE
jgi:nicotinamide-nucleotide amidase